MMCTMACSTSQSDADLYKGAWKYPRIHADGRALVDEHGRTMMMRGINVGGGAKVPPFIPWEGTPQDPTFDTDLARFMDFPAGWGMNVDTEGNINQVDFSHTGTTYAEKHETPIFKSIIKALFLKRKNP